MLRSRRAVVILATSMAFYLGVSTALASEVGPNDFRISQMGPNGNTNFSGISPAVAYNSHDDLYLVVWYGDDGVNNENEVYGRLIRSDGAPVAAQFRVSDMGPIGDTDYGASNPAVAYNPIDNEFLVVWRGIDDGLGFDSEPEIFGQRLHADTGLHTGANDFRISDVGPPGSPANGAGEPDVVHNPSNNEYLVVWSANEGLGGLHNNEYEVYGQRISSTGGAVGSNDFRISQMGPDGNGSYRVWSSAVAYNSIDNEYLVVWSADDNTPPLVDNEDEIFGQRLSAVGGVVGADDFRISDMGPDGNPDFGGFGPDVAHNPGSNEFLVVWEGDDNIATVDEEFEVFGQRLSSTGGAVGSNDFRISDMGPDGDPSYYGAQPAVAYDPSGGGYLVVWAGAEETAPTVHEVEAYGQRLSSAGSGFGSNDFRISDMGPDGDNGFAGDALAVASGGPNLVVWYGEDNTPPLVDNEYEIFGQLLGDAGGGLPVGDDTVGLVDVSQGMWHLLDSSGAITSFWYGNPGDLPIAGDWDGDGVATPGLYRQSDGFFYSRNSNSTGIADAECFAGNPEDVPVVGDWDGDGDDNLGIYRPSEQKFYLFTIACTGSPMGAAQIELLFGNPGDKPVAGDWDGDGIDEPGLHRESTGFFYWRNTLDTGIASGEIFFGDPADRFASGDWGIVDDIDTPAVFRPSNSTFYFRHTLTQGIADSQFTWNAAGSGWLSVSGDFGLD